MATIKYLYRSTKPEAFLTLRFQYRNNQKCDVIFDYKTKVSVTSKYWSEQHNKKQKDIDLIELQSDIVTELSDLEKFVLNSFNSTNPDEVTKDWLNNLIDCYYNPKQINDIPTNLIEFIVYYIEYRKNEITKTSVQKFNVIKHKLQRFQEQRKHTILIKDIDENFKNEFINYQKSNNYAQNTIQRELNIIKTFCKTARYLGIETSLQLDKLKTDKQKVDKIYLTFQELETIEKTKYQKQSLENAKDWLIISCFTAQRVSDFLRFNKSMIRTENGKNLLEFTQQKTGKNMTIPLHAKVIEILNKRNGDFPYKISDQKYNTYIKEVCKIAGLDAPTKGSKNIDFRKVEGVYPKHELITSHIGRRSFATNFYGQIATSYLIYVTGHSTETMFLNYIGKSNKDLALEMANFF
jgi:integrase